ncbi:hypothetical protein PGT21_003524 [Puccinia graminis f. sp. tritici]|uniref:Uncharacterized protein n=1 Tax=Puccinia graminis f. sp. tritici TaxID=56615 RepID=A0A5B0Q529_PUCGR|nr:hypothetical protein PGT21_003524 [Puccinia graminis f. sp. tritici]
MADTGDQERSPSLSAAGTSHHESLIHSSLEGPYRPHSISRQRSLNLEMANNHDLGGDGIAALPDRDDLHGAGMAAGISLAWFGGLSVMLPLESKLG